MRIAICKGCGNKEKMQRAPPGAVPDGWSTYSGAVYCPACSADIPLVQLSQRMSESATSAIIDACMEDPGLRAALDHVRASQQPGSPEFVRLVRAAVEASCATGAEAFPKSIRALFNDVLACVSWIRVAEKVARGATAPSTDAQTTAPNGTDPFSL